MFLIQLKIHLQRIVKDAFMTLNLWMGNTTLSHLSSRYITGLKLNVIVQSNVSFTKVWAHSAVVSFFCYSPASSTSTSRARTRTPPKQPYCVHYSTGPYFGPIKTLTWRWLISSICREITGFSHTAVNMSVVQRGLLVSWLAGKHPFKAQASSVRVWVITGTSENCCSL